MDRFQLPDDAPDPKFHGYTIFALDDMNRYGYIGQLQDIRGAKVIANTEAKRFGKTLIQPCYQHPTEDGCIYEDPVYEVEYVADEDKTYIWVDETEN